MKLLQITEWLPQYQVPNLRSDVIAGVALAGLLIPEAMGYAGIAGLPPQAGLYATVFGLLAYAGAAALLLGLAYWRFGRDDPPERRR